MTRLEKLRLKKKLAEKRYDVEEAQQRVRDRRKDVVETRDEWTRVRRSLPRGQKTRAQSDEYFTARAATFAAKRDLAEAEINYMKTVRASNRMRERKKRER